MNVSPQEFTIAIFSFNRGGLLKNCVESCLSCFEGAQIIVYDDDSDDPDTLKILQGLGAEKVDVRPTNYQREQERHGALYRNMQRALSDCATPYLVFLQDDMQVVRRVKHATLETIASAFDDPHIAFVRTQFFKQMDILRFTPHFHEKAVDGLIRPIGTYSGCDIDHSYCDVMVADVEKLRNADWSFQSSERGNQHLAKVHFKYMPYLQKPFVFYCPEVPSYRDRKLYLASRIVQNKRQGQVIRYHTMTDQDTSRLENLQAGVLPVAEDFLRPTVHDVKRPFVFQDYARSNWLHVLYKIESRLWRIIAPLARLLFRK
jgi:glycosyltransferase involved in cell wall biosynthesis